jgi:hypothetical protein
MKTTRKFRRKTRKSRRKYKKRGGSRTFSEYFFGKKSKKEEEEERVDDYVTTRDPVDERDLKILVEAEEEKEEEEKEEESDIKPKSASKLPRYQVKSMYGTIFYEGDTPPTEKDRKKIKGLRQKELLERDERRRKKREQEQSKNKGGKKSRKSRRKRKMKGGSLIGTDLLTGINTTDTNSALAFGTTGGTNYMLDTITAKEVNTGDYMSPDLKPVPMV